MDYEKKYKEAFEKAKKFYEQGTITESLSYIFPELKESEEERIRKWLIAQLEIKIGDNATLDNMIYKAIAYLEKQDKQLNKTVFDAEDRMMLDAIAEGLHDIVVNYGWSYFENAPIDDILAWIKKKGEQNTFDYENANIQQKDFAPKAKQKFHEGDWVVISTTDDRKIVQVVSIEYFPSGQPRYITSEGKWFGDGTNAHLWDITKDAKDGDVLYHKAENGIEYIVMSKGLNEFNNIDSYFRYNSINGFGIDVPSVLSAKCDSITPATKEQRDTLMKAMADAGYTFDFDKKMLKKVEE